MAWFPLSELGLDRARRLESELTILPRSYPDQDEEPAPVRLFRYKGNPPTEFGVPREFFFLRRRMDHEIVWDVSDGEPASFMSRDGQMVSVDGAPPIKFNIRPEQEEVIDSIVKYMRGGGTGTILQAKPGFGKTTCGIEIARRLGRKTLILTHKENLLEQWQKRALEFFDGVTVGRIQQDIVDVDGHDIVIGLVQSIALRKYPEDIYTKLFGTVIIDETHRMGSQMFSLACPQFNARYRIGLTATPRRRDGAEDVFFWHIGEVRNIAHQKMLTPDVRTVVSDFKLIRTSSFDPSEAKKWLVLRIMVKNNARNVIILREIMAAAKSGRKILVLSDRVRHLEFLKQLFDEYCLQDRLPYTSSMYVRGRQLMEEDENGKKVIKTYNQTQADLDRAAKANVLFGTWHIACIPLAEPIIDYRRGTVTTFNLANSVLTMIGKGVAKEVSPSQFQATGIKQCIKVLTSNSSFVVSTDHRVLTQRGYVPANTLRSSDYLVVPRKIDVVDIAPELTEEECWMVGALLGDGCLSQTRKGVIHFVSADESLVDRMGKVLSVYGMSTHCYRKYHYRIRGYGRRGRGIEGKSPLRRIIENYNLDVIAPHKKIPEHILLWPDSHIRALLTGLIDTDGGVCTRRGELSFSSSSVALARQFKYLLWRLGYYGIIRESMGRKNGNNRYRTMYRVCVDAGQSICLVGELKGMLQRKASHVKAVAKATANDRIPSKFTKIVKNELKRRKISHETAYKMLLANGRGIQFLHSGRQGNVASVKLLLDKFELNLPEVTDALNYVWIPVRRIESAGEMEVGDISILETHNLLLGEFVVHNSEGLDLPLLDCLVMATPHSDVEQAVGRICRKVDGKKNPIVTDVVDTGIGLSLKSRLWREKQYQKIGAKFKPIETMVSESALRRL